jgi:hypothetical protein
MTIDKELPQRVRQTIGAAKISADGFLQSEGIRQSGFIATGHILYSGIFRQ